MALQVQDATLRNFFAKTGGLARGTGFLARFLIAWPESTQGNRPFTDAPENWPELGRFSRRVVEILELPPPIDDSGALNPIVLQMQPDTKAAWIAFHDAIEKELACGGELHEVRDVASKTADNAARLAALFQFFENGAGAIEVAAFNSASRVIAWHLNEARRFFGELALPPEIAAMGRLDSWLVNYCRKHGTTIVPTKVVLQFGPSDIRVKSAVDSAVKALSELGRAREWSEGTRRGIELNPAILEGAP